MAFLKVFKLIVAFISIGLSTVVLYPDDDSKLYDNSQADTRSTSHFESLKVIIQSNCQSRIRLEL